MATRSPPPCAAYQSSPESSSGKDPTTFGTPTNPPTFFWKDMLTTDLGMLSHQGFNTVIESQWSEFPDDGVVFRVDNYTDFERMGYTSHHPRGAFALKSIQTGVNTKLLDVVWNVGKSGVVAPTAILEPVEIDGANVSRATLHNMRYISDLRLEIGCTVEVIRSGEIIPKIVRRID